MSKLWQAIIIGSGPAGISAARVLNGMGLDILLIDENRRLGGQFLRQASDLLGSASVCMSDPLRNSGLDQIARLQAGSLEIRTGAQILEIEPDGTLWALEKDGRIRRHQGEYILVCTGAREKFLPFSGWTLPGVVSCGGAQILMKSCGMLPGHDMVVGGAGPLPLVLAGELLAAGGRVKAFWDQTPVGALSRGLVHFRHHFKKMAQGLGYLARLAAARTPIRFAATVVEARGRGALNQVVLARLDRQGRPIDGTAKTYPADCLAVGHGFAPNIELALLAGCELIHDPAKGGWIIQVDDRLVTSNPRFLAAGEVTGIAGAQKAFLEGRLAGLTMTRCFGKIDDDRYQEQKVVINRQRQWEMVFGEYVNTMTMPPAGLLDVIPDDTIICRCEDITMGQVRKQIANGFTSLDAIKKSTNAGMGHCQGRTCGPILQDILEIGGDVPDEAPRPFTVRKPIKPVPFSALADLADLFEVQADQD